MLPCRVKMGSRSDGHIYILTYPRTPSARHTCIPEGNKCKFVYIYIILTHTSSYIFLCLSIVGAVQQREVVLTPAPGPLEASLKEL